MEDIICVYRISDLQQTSAHKPKLPRASKASCLGAFLRVFGRQNTTIVADAVSDESFETIKAIAGDAAVVRTDFRSGASSFLFAVSMVLDGNPPSNTAVYMCEDDYVHQDGSRDLITEGLRLSHYCSLYDHPDKYEPGRVQPCVLLPGETRHWRTTPSTTMTFATRVGTLRQDMEVYNKYCSSGYPHDHQMFLELGAAGRRLVTCVPGASTHAECRFLSPYVDWDSVIQRHDECEDTKSDSAGVSP